MIGTSGVQNRERVSDFAYRVKIQPMFGLKVQL
jgi:hypothetical protein